MKLPNPVNKNNAHNAEHVCYMGTTGSCKTTAIRRLNFIERQSQVVMFDPYSEHLEAPLKGGRVQACYSFDEFYHKAWFARKKKAAFRLALVEQDRTRENLEQFANMVWSLGNGHHPKKLHCVIEELAKFTHSPSKLDGIAGELWTGGRGFGLVMHATFQRGQEVPKTVLDESKYVYVGAVSSRRNAKYISEYFDIPIDAILSLQSCVDREHLGRKKFADYILKSPGLGKWQQGKIYPNR
ncbi:hypothetical protein Q8W42_17870 [Vibrio splendidus]|uniref:Type IV secretion system coupling protein TraD DNA-binding domain-containing protein n=1 Tax=Vibrio splendidus TaxID=29497 RepID=A0AB35N151_VIBSP|nr:MULTISPECIES: hypothetical protein [Vibrio]MDP2502586.1 hypothetical protein [Vibrio splendidus]CAK1956240.1 Type IV secretion system coupling protein TraD DNA-binding domain-containing protein [Vibrio crassostreae]